MASALSESTIMTTLFKIPSDQLAEFCRRWKVAELALFGSALREDFRPDSDVDLLVTFSPDAAKTRGGSGPCALGPWRLGVESGLPGDRTREMGSQVLG